MEPPAEEFLHKLQRVEMLATRPLSYAEVVAKPPAAFLWASGVAAQFYLYCHSTWGLTRCWREGTSFSSREETVSIDCLKPHLRAGPFSPALPILRSCGVSASAVSGSFDSWGAMLPSGLVINLGVCEQ
jgi:hypothetical protein